MIEKCGHRQLVQERWISLLAILIMSVGLHSAIGRGITIGESVPAFSLPSVTGESVSSDVLKDRIGILVFIKLSQEYTDVALRDLDMIYESLAVHQDRLKWIAILPSAAAPDEVQQVFGTLRVPFRVLVDENRAMYNAYGIIVTPTVQVIDTTGTLRAHFPGYEQGFRLRVEKEIEFLLGLISRDELESALVVVTRAKGQDRSADRYYALAQRELAQGNRARALETLEKVLQLNPAKTDAAVQVGFLLLGEGRVEEAQLKFQHALSHNKFLLDAQLGMGECYLAAGDIEKAEPLVSKVLEAKPRFARAHFAMGRLMEKKGELRKAMEEYRQACELAFRGE